MNIKIQMVQRGDVILEGAKRITVAQVERYPVLCKGHVHVNGALCWDRDSVVSVERREG